MGCLFIVEVFQKNVVKLSKKICFEILPKPDLHQDATLKQGAEL
jgi:hypothetical protein